MPPACHQSTPGRAKTTLTETSGGEIQLGICERSQADPGIGSRGGDPRTLPCIVVARGTYQVRICNHCGAYCCCSMVAKRRPITLSQAHAVRTLLPRKQTVLVQTSGVRLLHCHRHTGWMHTSLMCCGNRRHQGAKRRHYKSSSFRPRGQPPTVVQTPTNEFRRRALFGYNIHELGSSSLASPVHITSMRGKMRT